MTTANTSKTDDIACLQTDCPRYEACPRRLARGCGECPLEETDGPVQRIFAWSALSSERKELILMLVAAFTLALGGLFDWRGWGMAASAAYTLTY